MSHVTHINESRHTHEWVMPHTWMSHATHMKESRHTHTQIMSHRYIPHYLMSLSRVEMSHVHTSEWVMPHKWTSHVTHTRKTCHMWHALTNVSRDIQDEERHRKTDIVRRDLSRKTFTMSQFTMSRKTTRLRCFTMSCLTMSRKTFVRHRKTMSHVHTSYVYVWHDSFICVAWLIPVCHDSFRKTS